MPRDERAGEIPRAFRCGGKGGEGGGWKKKKKNHGAIAAAEFLKALALQSGRKKSWGRESFRPSKGEGPKREKFARASMLSPCQPFSWS